MYSLGRLAAATFKPTQYFCSRHLSSDPVQKAFIQYIHEYGKKSEKAEMGLVDASKDEIKSLYDMLHKLDNAYDAKGQDMKEFPSLNFENPKIKSPGSDIVADFVKEEASGEEEVSEPEYIPGTLVI